MLAALDELAIGIIVPMLLDLDGHRYWSLRREPTLARAIGDRLPGDRIGRRPGWLSEMVRNEAYYDYRHPVDWATGAAMLVSAHRAAVILHELLRSSDPSHRIAMLAGLRRCRWPELLVDLRAPSADPSGNAAAHQLSRPRSAGLRR
jgi:hypothetical protein